MLPESRHSRSPLGGLPVGSHDRKAHRQGFYHRTTQALVHGGKTEHIGGREEVTNVLAVSEERNDPLETQLIHRLAEINAGISVTAGDDDSQIGTGKTKPGGSLQQVDMSFLILLSAKGENDLIRFPQIQSMRYSATA